MGKDEESLCRPIERSQGKSKEETAAFMGEYYSCYPDSGMYLAVRLGLTNSISII